MALHDTDQGPTNRDGAQLLSGPGSSSSCDRARVAVVILLGEGVSSIGSEMTMFALRVRVYEETASVTATSLISFFASWPGVFLLPILGTLLDQCDRRYVLICSQLGAAVSTMLMAVLPQSDSATLWHIYIALALRSAFVIVQGPTYAAIIPVLIPKRLLGRANGAVQFVVAGSQIVAPLIAGLLLQHVTLKVIILLDFATYVVALGTLAVIRVPTVPTVRPTGKFLQESIQGFRYMVSRKGLVALLVLGAFVNSVFAGGQALLVPYILHFSTTTNLATILSCGGVGVLLGSIVQGVWGGPCRRMHAVVGFTVVLGLCLVCTGICPSTGVIALATFAMWLAVPLMIGCTQAIWQTKIPLHVQGRVFALKSMISRSLTPVAYLAVGPLNDEVFEPLLDATGALSGTVGLVMGVGPGRGTGLLLVVLGLFVAAGGIAAYRYPPLRRVEDDVADAFSLCSSRSTASRS